MNVGKFSTGLHRLSDLFKEKYLNFNTRAHKSQL